MLKVYRLLLLALLVTGIFTGNVYASEVNRMDVGGAFDGFTGTMVLYDEKQDIYFVYNEVQSNKPLSPCSTFKIYNSLIGLELGILDKDDRKTLVKWDGTKYSIDSWNQDQTLSTATKNSAVWYYQDLAAKIGQERMQSYLEKFNYSNKDISGGLTNFWLRSSLKISAYEQVELLRNLFSGKLHVSEDNVNIVKKNILQVKEDEFSYYGKTGTADQNGKSVIGWWIGCVEKDGNRYFFATNIEGEDNANGGKARRITENILKQMDIIHR